MKTLIRNITVLVALVTVAITARAQVMDKKTLTIEGAKRVIAAAAAEAKRLNAPGGVIAVVDDGGNLMAVERLDGTFACGANISIGKAKTWFCLRNPLRCSRTSSRTVARRWLHCPMRSLLRCKARVRQRSLYRSHGSYHPH